MTTTPDREVPTGPVVASIAITETQKQALIDNLQLEITERARKLRAQYALQAQGLRTRLEMRVNRIPQALRKANMQELLEKYAAGSTETAKIVAPKQTQIQRTSSPVLSRGAKRTSDVLHTFDKENEAPATSTIENPKKRTKITATVVAPTATATATTKAVTRKPVPGQVLSPKSHNSRTFPASPVKIPSPTKTFVPRPASPAKPLLTGPTAAKQTRPVSRQIKRPVVTTASSQSTLPEAARKPSARNSSASDSTTTTTIMKKSTAAPAKSTKVATTTTTTTSAAAKRTGTIKSALQSLTGSKRGKKAVDLAPAPTPEPAKTTTVGGRTLRKRGSDNGTTVPVPKPNTATLLAKSNSVKSTATTATAKEKVKGIVHSFKVLPRNNDVTKSIDKLTGQGKRRSSTAGIKRFGSRRIGKVVEKGKALLNTHRKK